MSKLYGCGSSSSLGHTVNGGTSLKSAVAVAAMMDFDRGEADGVLIATIVRVGENGEKHD